MKEWNDRIAILEKQPQVAAQYAFIKKALEADDMKLLEGQLIGASGFDRDLENYLANLLRASRESDESRERIKAFLDERLQDKKSKMRSFATGRIQALRKAIEN
jgi:hypothetical protein